MVMPLWEPLVVVLVAALATYGLDRWLLDWFLKQKIQSSIRKDGPATHQSKAKTPALGGAAFPLGFFLALLVIAPWLGKDGDLDLHDPRQLVTIALLAFIVAMSFLLGFADDYLKVIRKSSEGLKARYRFPVQLLLGLLLGYAVSKTVGASYMQFLPIPHHEPMGLKASWLLVLWTMLFFSATLNGVNFTDGLDTLLAGTALPALVVLAGLSYGWFGEAVQPNILLGHAALAGAGTLLGFYPLNRHPAKLFMGDGGAYFLAALMATIAVLQGSVFLFFLIGLVFFLELVSVMIQVTVFRLTGGRRRVFPMAPLHHSFEVKGWPEERVVSLFWGIALLSAILSIALARSLQSPAAPTRSTQVHAGTHH